MSRKIEINLDEALQAFMVLEDIVNLLHQPNNYNANDIEEFAIQQGGYKKVAELYYNVVWNWLPTDVKQTIENR